MVWIAVFDNGRRERVLGVGPEHAARRLARRMFGDLAYPVAHQLDDSGGLFQIVSRRSGRVLAVVDISREKKAWRRSLAI